MEIKSNSSKELWTKALRYIYLEGDEFKDNAKRICKEVLRLSLTLEGDFSDISSPIDILSNYKKWVYPSLQEIENIIIDGNSSKSYAYSYGQRIFSFENNEKKVNQIDNFIIPLLKEDKNSRRAVVSLWNPIKDSFKEKRHVPGLVSIDFKIRNEKLHITSIVRSNEIFIGWPANLYQIYSLGKYISSKLGIDIGSICTISTSAHIFKESYNDIKTITKN